MGGDPVEAGLVATLSRPGGNLTGTTLMGVELGPKRLELVRQLIPNAITIAMLVNPNFPLASSEVRDVQASARSLGLQTDILNASTERDIDEAFANIAQRRSSALIVGTDPFFLGQRDQLARLAARHAVPSMYHLREFVEAGGLVSYGPSIVKGYQKAGAYTGQILNGAKPADLPVWQPTVFELVIN